MAASRKDLEEKGGYGHCDNVPKKLTTDDAFGAAGELSLVPLSDTDVQAGGQRGLKLRLVNRTDERVKISALDSHLYIVQEAQDREGKWRAIERKPRGTGPRDCAVGNHRVSLDPDEYWVMSAPRFTGSLQTKIRFRLDLGRKLGKFPSDGGKVIYSPEFDGSVDPELLAADQKK